ncbi:MAG: Ig-like domain repeat protein [Nocardioidaceae bacterium]|nr:Ig-like domain repeat protein [Nocardioidaceae bacterium]
MRTLTSAGSTLRTKRWGGSLVALLVAMVASITLTAPSTAATPATVTGRLVTDAGVPVDAMSAVLVQSGLPVDEFTTGTDGTFELSVPAGDYIFTGSDNFNTYSFISKPLTLADGESRALGDIEVFESGFTSPNARLVGHVYDPAGKPARGIQVLARTNTPLQGDSVVGGFAVTDRNGRYVVDTDGSSGPPVPGTYKLVFSDRFVVPETFNWGGRYSGDQPTWARASTVTIGGTLQTVPDVTVTRNGGISGSITGTVPMTNGTITVYDLDGEQVATKTGAAGAYAITTLRPGSYFVRFSSPDPAPGGGSPFVRSFWPGASSLAGATPVVVKANQFTAGVNQVLSNQLTAFRKPTISGRALVGSTLIASPGAWSLTAGTEYTYEWLRGITVVGTAPSYRPTAADVGKALSVRVTARLLDRSGVATSLPTAAVKRVSTVTARAAYRSARKQLVLTIRVAVPGLANPGGTVTVKEGSRLVKARVAVRNGTAVVVISRPRAGRHGYGLSYSGTPTVLADTGSVVASVPRR